MPDSPRSAGSTPPAAPAAGAAATPEPLRAPEISRKVIVRLLDQRDSVHEMTELLHRAYKRHADRGMRAIAAFQDDITTVRRIAGGECYVAALRDDDRRIVGTIVFKSPAQTKGTPWFERGDVASFSQLAVEPWLQGRGIGGLLIRTAERRAVECSASEIALSTPEPATELVSMYEHKGYRTVEHMNWPGTNYRSAIMSKATSAVRVDAAPPVVITSAPLATFGPNPINGVPR